MAVDTGIQLARPRLEGYLRCICETDTGGRSRITKKDYRVPIHISKPYWDGQTLLLNVMSPTAGMLEGDHVDLDIEVRPKAALAISNPTSLRIHKMSTEGKASWTQRFKVASDAFLECNPEWLMLQGECAFVQLTEIDVEQGGELFFIEALAPGRVAHGEAFAFRSFKNRLSLRYDNKLAASEKHRIEPSSDTHLAWDKQAIETPFYVSIFLISERIHQTNEFFEFVRNLQTETIRIGVSQLANGPCWNVKALSADSALLRDAVETIRRGFYESTNRSAPNLRR